VQGDGRYSYGFGVRASSTKDPALLEFAYRSGGYSLPGDMGYGEVDPRNAPKRLALVHATDKLDALIHTSHVTWDTSTPRRPGSYFSHILFVPALPLKAALESWAAPGWMNDYPQGATKDLSPLTA